MGWENMEYCHTHLVGFRGPAVEKICSVSKDVGTLSVVFVRDFIFLECSFPTLTKRNPV